MNATTIQPIGAGVIAIPESVADDPRIVAKVAEIQSGTNPVDAAQLEAMEDSDFSLLEKYGLKPRQAGLRMSARMARILEYCPLNKNNERELPDAYMGHVGVFLIAAPPHRVVNAIEIGAREGFGMFIETMDEWFDASGLPDDVTKEAADEIGRIFLLAAKLSQADGTAKTVKKTNSPGSSSVSGPSEPSTAGLKTISGNKSQSPG